MIGRKQTRFSPDTGQKYTIDSSQFDIYLKAKIGECLWSGLVDILGLYTLGRQTEADVTNTLYLSCQARITTVNSQGLFFFLKGFALLQVIS